MYIFVTGSNISFIPKIPPHFEVSTDKILFSNSIVSPTYLLFDGQKIHLVMRRKYPTT